MYMIENESRQRRFCMVLLQAMKIYSIVYVPKNHTIWSWISNDIHPLDIHQDIQFPVNIHLQLYSNSDLDFGDPRKWVGDFIYLVSSWGPIYHIHITSILAILKLADLNFAWPKTSPKSRDYCTRIHLHLDN